VSKEKCAIAPFGLRMPPMLKERIRRAAQDNGRSMNAEIVSALEKEYPEDVYSADEFVDYLQSLAEPMDPESQIVHAETLNSMFDHMGVDLEAHLQSGDIIIMRKTPPK
jgi:hypothetical protein